MFSHLLLLFRLLVFTTILDIIANTYLHEHKICIVYCIHFGECQSSLFAIRKQQETRIVQWHLINRYSLPSMWIDLSRPIRFQHKKKFSCLQHGIFHVNYSWMSVTKLNKQSMWERYLLHQYRYLTYSTVVIRLSTMPLLRTKKRIHTSRNPKTFFSEMQIHSDCKYI